MRRLLDLIISVAGLVALSPVFLLVTLYIWLSDGRPVLFSQERVGHLGKPFWILKFRTMTEPVVGTANRVTAAGDHRITRTGKLLRRLKLDELPQLINVALGDMTLVGPRPETPYFVDHYPPLERNIVLSVKPGITDPVTLLNIDEESLLAGSVDPERYYIEVLLPRKIAGYISYIQHRTLPGDMQIVLRTVLAVIRRGLSA